jgi:hypothetical protein
MEQGERAIKQMCRLSDSYTNCKYVSQSERG